MNEVIRQLNQDLSHIKYLTGYVFDTEQINMSFFDFFRFNRTYKFVDVTHLWESIPSLEDWVIGRIRSSRPLKSERTGINSFYEYDFFFSHNVSNKKTLLLSENKEIARLLLEFIQHQNSNCISYRIDTEKILSKILDTGFNETTQSQEKTAVSHKAMQQFSITFLHARVSGMQDKLNSISLYGKDVIRSFVYQKFHDNFNPVSCGLSIEEDAFLGGYSEVVRLSNDGLMRFNARDIEVFSNVNDVITFAEKSNCFLLP